MGRICHRYRNLINFTLISKYSIIYIYISHLGYKTAVRVCDPCAKLVILNKASVLLTTPKSTQSVNSEVDPVKGVVLTGKCEWVNNYIFYTHCSV